MKLNKDTRNEVKLGTALIENGFYYQVTAVYETRYGKQITVKLQDGTFWRCVALSKFYGCEIDNSNDTATLYDNVCTILADKVQDVIIEVQGNATDINPWYEYHFDRKIEELARLITEAITEATQETENYGADPE